MSMYEYLKNDQEPIPNWLLEIKEGDKFSRDDFFSSRIVFIRVHIPMGMPLRFLVQPVIRTLFKWILLRQWMNGIKKW